MSIVTPTLNRAQLLEATIQSVRRQTYPRIEHIVVDGGSTDGSLEILRRLEGSYPLRWVSEADGGMYAAINKGLRLASGEIVAYLNDDDLYFPWSVEAAVEGFSSDREADFVYGASLAVDDESGVQSLRFEPQFNLDFIRRCGFLCQPAVFWKAKVMDDVGGFDESLRFAADIEFWMRAGASHRFVRIDEALAIERNHRHTIRERYEEDILRELGAIRGRYVDMTGRAHRLRTLGHRIRTAIGRRIQWLLFAREAMKRPASRRSWRRLLNSEQPEVRWLLFPVKAVPIVSWWFPRLLRPSRYWLDPSRWPTRPGDDGE